MLPHRGVRDCRPFRPAFVCRSHIINLHILKCKVYQDIFRASVYIGRGPFLMCIFQNRRNSSSGFSDFPFPQSFVCESSFLRKRSCCIPVELCGRGRGLAWACADPGAKRQSGKKQREHPVTIAATGCLLCFSLTKEMHPFRPCGSLRFPRSSSAASPAKRVAVESEEIPTRVQFSAKPETERWWEFLSWRRRRDSNPRDPLGAYMISNHAPSTN